MDKTYRLPLRVNKLHDELWAAGVRTSLLESDGDGAQLATFAHIVAPQGVAIVDAVVAAHDPTTPSTAEQQATADGASLNDLATTYANMVTKLEAIAADMTTLGNHATTLSTVTVSGTLAQTQATVQANLRALGTDLGTLVADVSALAAGSERVLKVAQVFVRRQGS